MGAIVGTTRETRSKLAVRFNGGHPVNGLPLPLRDKENGEA